MNIGVRVTLQEERGRPVEKTVWIEVPPFEGTISYALSVDAKLIEAARKAYNEASEEKSNKQ